MTDASHVRNAFARFDRVKDVSDFDLDLAFANTQKAARQFGMTVIDTNWRQLGTRREDSWFPVTRTKPIERYTKLNERMLGSKKRRKIDVRYRCGNCNL
jgi:hypothetical protein